MRSNQHDESSVGGVASREKPQQVADQLRWLIVNGRFGEGDSLGTEAELLERFDVSRPSLREALRILEAEGLISVVRGALGGVIVHRPDQRMTARTAALVLQSRSVPLADVFDASAVLEPAAARLLAASRARRHAAQQLRSLIAEQKRTINDPVAYFSALTRFHAEIVTLAGNQTLIIVVEMLNEVIARAMADAMPMAREATVASRRGSIRSQELLVSLIEAGEGDAAQAHWKAHMAGVRRNLLGERATTVVDMTNHF